MRSVAVATTLAFGLVGTTGVLAASAGNSAGSIGTARVGMMAGNSAGSIGTARVGMMAGNSAGSVNLAMGTDASATQPGRPEESGPCPMPEAPAPQESAKPVVTKPATSIIKAAKPSKPAKSAKPAKTAKIAKTAKAATAAKTRAHAIAAVERRFAKSVNVAKGVAARGVVA